MKKNYNLASIHEVIANCEDCFALRTTRANLDLNLILTKLKDAIMPLKIISFLAIQIHQDMMMIISKAKGTLN